ncbi:armadillo-type protein [Pelagophyceae sp. CCMP2097]|nr:armadillo-type protein [Pelagophyceae sp. CCMP2097]
MDLSAVLLQAQAPDPQLRGVAEAQLLAWEQQSLAPFALALAQHLASEEAQPNSRQLAGLHLKNLVSSREAVSALEKKSRYFTSVDADTRTQLKAFTLSALRSGAPQAANTASQVVAQLGVLELSERQWPELLAALLNNMNSTECADPDLLKTATLEALGYLCEDLDEDVLQQSETNQVLTAIIDGLGDARSMSVRTAAATALLNSLVFTRHNFEAEAERTAIMRAVCAAAAAGDARLRGVAFEALARVCSLYYSFLAQYIEAIFALTLNAIRTDEESVAMMAVEVWATLSEEEIELLDDESASCQNYLAAAAGHILPVLLESCLLKQDEAADEDAWNVAAAGAVCLGLVAQAVGDAAVPAVLAFVEGNILHADWRRREAATMAFGQLLEGPSTAALAGPVQTAMEVLIRSLSDAHTLVKDTAAWALARVCELHAASIPPGHLHPLVERLALALRDASARVAAQACFALHNLAQAFEAHQSEAQTNALSPFFAALLRQLLETTERSDWREHHLRVQAYEAVNVLIQHHAPDARAAVLEALQLILVRLEATFSTRVNSQDDCDDRDQLQALLCSVLQVSIRAVGKDVQPCSDRLAALLLHVLANRDAVACEEALMALGALASTLEASFEKYMAEFFPHLIQGLQNYNEWQVCAAAVGCVGDVCRALETKTLPFCDQVVTCLLQNLQNPDLSRVVKPAVLSCFGDIALAVGGDFAKYLPSALAMLDQAARTTVPADDDELVEYLTCLREGILEAYTGVCQGLSDGGQANLLVPHLQSLFAFLHVVSADAQTNHDDSQLKACVGLVGDLASSLSAHGQELVPFLRLPFVRTMLEEAASNEGLEDISAWALKQVLKFQG